MSTKVHRSIWVETHLWDAFDEMAKAMGSDREALVNQAMFTFARLNGFLESRGPAGPRRVVASSVDEGSEPDPAHQTGEGDPPTSHQTADLPAQANEDSSTASKYIGMGLSDANTSESTAPTNAGRGLFVALSDGRREKVSKPRFIIGRGRQCDLVIDSGKVSREHLAITREGSDYFVEDLKSSNGTFFNRQRITRRKIESGDEYLICGEKIILVIE
jgi:pSer/pThr/pTyr-binding forkhead associated (FHA) protein